MSSRLATNCSPLLANAQLQEKPLDLSKTENDT
jgi:hypothetical protein